MQVIYQHIDPAGGKQVFEHEWKYLRGFLLGVHAILTKAPEPNVLHWHQRGQPVFAITFPSVLQCVMAHRDYCERLAGYRSFRPNQPPE